MSFGMMIDPTSSGGSSTAQDQSKVQEAINKFAELTDVQKKVDAAIASLPPGPDKDRLIKERDASRGFFQSTIIPAWNKLREMIGYPTASANTLKGYEDDHFGIIPALAWYAGSALAVSAAVALIAYMGQSIYAEYKILNDPALSGAQRVQALQSRGIANIFSSLTSSITMLGVVGSGIFLAYLYLKGKKLEQR